jgi:glycosyltransferase involved in cell wall biosynthesis
MKSPTICICIPCYNTQNYILSAVQSCLSQNKPADRIIVVDDGSTDNSLELIKDIPGIQVLKKENGGVSSARNLGLQHSREDYIIFLDSDDILKRTALKTYLSAIEKYNHPDLLYGNNDIIDSEGKLIRKNFIKTGKVTLLDVLYGNNPVPSQTVFNRNIIQRLGGFDTSLYHSEDFDLLLKVLNCGTGISISDIVVEYRKHPEQATQIPGRSLQSTLYVIDRFRESRDLSIDWNPIYRKWKVFHGQYIPIDIIKSIRAGRIKNTFKGIIVYSKGLPYTLFGTLKYIKSRTFRRTKYEQ